jgi:hypothetical protein
MEGETGDGVVIKAAVGWEGATAPELGSGVARPPPQPQPEASTADGVKAAEMESDIV